MNNKDLLKMLLCSYGYDRNILIYTYKGDGGCLGYEIHAENKDGDVYSEENCEGIMFHIYKLLDFMQKEKIPLKSQWWDTPAKIVINDIEREQLIKKWDKQEKENQELLERSEPLYTWLKENNPCINCTENPRDLDWYPHYNCSKNYHHSCEKLKTHHKNYQDFKREILRDKN